MMKFCADTSHLDIECSILDIQQGSGFRVQRTQADIIATKARRHEEEAATAKAMTVLVVKSQRAAAAQ